LICRLEAVEVPANVNESGAPFSAVVPEDVGVVIQKGAIVIEMDNGAQHPAVIEDTEVIPDPFGPVVKITGVLGATKSDA